MQCSDADNVFMWGILEQTNLHTIHIHNSRVIVEDKFLTNVVCNFLKHNLIH